MNGVKEDDITSFSWARDWFVGRRVLVVGGSSGIGAGIARGFLEAGAEVLVTGVSADEVKKTASTPSCPRLLPLPLMFVMRKQSTLKLGQ